MTLGPIIHGVTRYIVSLGLLVAIWASATWLIAIPAYLLPRPDAVLVTLTNERAAFLAAALATFTNAVIGGVCGILAGLALGGLAAFSRTFRWIVEPYLGLAQSFPRESLFPLFIVWLGFGALPKMLSAALLACFPMAVIALDALSNTRADYLELMTSWKASRLQTFLACRVPAAVPALIGGLKVCLPLALIGAVLGEFLGGSEGLGFIVVSAGSAFRVDRIFGAIVVLAAIGGALVGTVELLRVTIARRYYQE